MLIGCFSVKKVIDVQKHFFAGASTTHLSCLFPTCQRTQRFSSFEFFMRKANIGIVSYKKLPSATNSEVCSILIPLEKSQSLRLQTMQ